MSSSFPPIAEPSRDDLSVDSELVEWIKQRINLPGFTLLVVHVFAGCITDFDLNFQRTMGRGARLVRCRVLAIAICDSSAVLYGS